MKKLIFLITFIAVVAITAGYNMYIALDKKVYMTEFILTNLCGSVYCSGQRCSRVIDWKRGAFVECDGYITFC